MFISTVWFLPFVTKVKRAWGAVKKKILPKDTSRKSLIGKNPARLDTRHLEVTPLEDFETMGQTSQKTDLDTWRLQMDGEVEKPMQWTYGQLLEMPAIERDVLLICPGVFANHGRWKGVSIKSLFEACGIKPSATHISVRGPKPPDTHHEKFEIREALSDKIFLAYQVNGHALPEKHGYPVRLVAEGYYGMDWTKYVYRLTVETD